MATTKKSQMAKIEAVLRKNTAGAGVSVAQIANLARVSKDAVYKRVYDLRETHTIYSNYRSVNGKKKLFYRLAAG